MSATQTAPTTTVKTGEVRLSFAHIWKPTAARGSDKLKYSVSLLIKKSDKATVKVVQAAIENAKAVYVSKFGALPKNWDNPLHDGDEEKSDDENYADCWYLNAKSDQKPGIVHLENGKVVPLEDESELVSGDYAKVQINFFPYNNVNKGIGVGLNNIFKTRQDVALSGRQAATAAFADEQEDDI